MSKGLTLLTLCLGLFSSLAVPATGPSAEETPRRIEITAQRFHYSPNEVTVRKGESVVLILNSMDVAHGLRISALGIDLQVKAGGSTQVQFRPNQTGDFSGHCSTFCGAGHGSMTLNVHVVD